MSSSIKSPAPVAAGSEARADIRQYVPDVIRQLALEALEDE